MAKIDYIKLKKAWAEISLNGEVLPKINLEAMLKSALKEGYVSDTDIQNLLIESDKLNAKKSLISSISRNLKTEKEVRIRLYQKGFPKYAVDYAIEFAKKYGYINDRNYSFAFTQSGIRTKGEHRIRYELRQKGISDDMIEDALGGSSDMQNEAATSLAERYMKGKETSLKNLDNLFRYLMMRGYDYEIVKPIIDHFRKTNNL